MIGMFPSRCGVALNEQVLLSSSVSRFELMRALFGKAIAINLCGPLTESDLFVAEKDKRKPLYFHGTHLEHW